MSDPNHTRNDPSVALSPVKVSGDTPPNHIPIAIVGGVAFAAAVCFWAYHFSTAAVCNSTSPGTHNIFCSTTGSAL